MYNNHKLKLFFFKIFNEFFMNYCLYYQAKLEEKNTLFVTATLRSFDNLAFDRCLNANNIFEFFVPNGANEDFLKIMSYFENKGVVSDLKFCKNRFIL